MRSPNFTSQPRTLATRLVAGLAAPLLLLAACGSDEEEPTAGETTAGGEASAEDLFTDTLMWTSPAAAGGGTGLMTELLVTLAKREGPYPHDIVVDYREGGGGTRGYGYVYQQAGNPHSIVSTNSSFIATPLQAETEWDSSKFTPVALMGRDYPIFVVPGDSDVETMEDFIAKAQDTDPAIGGVGTVNLSYIIPTIFAEAAGFDFRHVAFDGTGALHNAMLSGSLDGTTGEPAEVAGLLASGDFRALATMDPNGLPAGSLPDVDYDIPSFVEAGVDMPDLFTPRGIALPPDMDPAVTEWWIETAKKIAATDEWQQYLADNMAQPGELYGEDFGAFLADTVATFEDILTEAGVIQ